MEVYRTEDNQVSKYVHDDGSETTIKTVSSCDNEIDPATGKVRPVAVNRNKYSVFVSASSGCPLGCKFCYLTAKKFPYKKLTPDQIISNFAEALKEEVTFKPEMRKMYMKLSWMGMGDAFLLDPTDLRYMTKHMVDYAVGSSGFAFGLDGVDVATIMPDGCYGWPHNLGALNDYLIKRYHRNSNNNYRSAVRLFYSLHRVVGRSEIIPSASLNGTEKDLELLAEFRRWYGVDIVLHHMFLAGINDTMSDLADLGMMIYKYFKDVELRVLRFNECENSPYKESEYFDDLVSEYVKVLPKVKYQISAGSEISAACGQFLCLTNKDK
jgi:adenine C2-methylase RlmN of 23S rRNA A2503 and tRNA A37